MDIEGVIARYEEEIRVMNEKLEGLYVKNEGQMEGCVRMVNEICQVMKESGIKLREIDNLDQELEERTEIVKLAREIEEVYEKISGIQNDKIEEFVQGFLECEDFTQKMPHIKSLLFEELQILVLQRRQEILSQLKTMFDRSFVYDEKKIIIGPDFDIIQKQYILMEAWDDQAKIVEEAVEAFVKSNYLHKVSTKVLTSAYRIKAKEQEIDGFKEILDNFREIFSFFALAHISPKKNDAFVGCFESVVGNQAVLCVKNDKLKEESLKTTKEFESFLENLGLGVENRLSKMIENCEEATIVFQKNKQLEGLRDLLLKPLDDIVKLNSGVISKNTEKYRILIESCLNCGEETEHQRVSKLFTAREGLVLFLALRKVSVRQDMKDLALFCSDCEYLLEGVSNFTKDLSNFPKGLQYLADFSDLFTLFREQVDGIYKKMVESLKKMVHERTQHFEFSEFDNSFSSQEANLIRALQIIKQSELTNFLPKETSSVLIGQVVDTLLKETLSQISHLKAKDFPDIQFIRHFFNKISELQEIFNEENPRLYCKNWPSLEKLTDLIDNNEFEEFRLKGLKIV